MENLLAALLLVLVSRSLRHQKPLVRDLPETHQQSSKAGCLENPGKSVVVLDNVILYGLIQELFTS